MTPSAEQLAAEEEEEAKRQELSKKFIDMLEKIAQDKKSGNAN
ncbi:MAG: hypothetical protein AAGI28_13755 [Pseudomonadota bacterium]